LGGGGDSTDLSFSIILYLILLLLRFHYTKLIQLVVIY